MSIDRDSLIHYHKYLCPVSEGISNNWRVEKYSYTEDHINNMLKYAAESQKPVIAFPNITYTKLYYKDTVVMLDEPVELYSCQYLLDRVEGSIFITGLGLGILPSMLLDNDKVTFITIVENSKDVLELVYNNYYDKIWDKNKIEVIEADGWNYIPYRKYDYGWHDLWLDNFDHDESDELITLYKGYIENQISWLDHLYDWQINNK